MSIQVQNHWFFSCLTVVFWLNYSSVPWIRLADITRFRTRMKFKDSHRAASQKSVLSLLEYELNVQGCFVIQLSSFCVAFSFSAKAFIFYHNFFRLSRTFFIFLILNFAIFSEATCLFYYIRLILSSTFYYYFHFSKKSEIIIRRRRDLNPRTAQTIYTLSRGASSAT